MQYKNYFNKFSHKNNVKINTVHCTKVICEH